MLDESINQTLSRTLMTKLVTLLVVVALLLFGGETLRGFSAGAGHRHPRRHLFLDLHLGGAGARLRPAAPTTCSSASSTKPEEVDGLP